MKIVKPYAKLIAPWAFVGPSLNQGIPLEEEAFDEDACRSVGQDALRFIEWCSRISHRAEDKQTMISYERFIQNVVIEHGDWSVVEHVSVSVDMLVDRGITHELVRHRLFSFTQESTRFVNYEKKMPPSFIYPIAGVECKHCLAGEEHECIADEWRHNNDEENCIYNSTWLVAIDNAESSYIELLKQGWRPQEARSVLPNALASRIVVTGNLRNWRHLFIMRTTKETHPQFKQVSIPLLAEFKSTFPILFDDIVPDNRQIDNLKLPR